jgi:hypothetical protein
MDTGTSLAEKMRGIRLDSRNIKVKLGIIPTEEVQAQMFLRISFLSEPVAEICKLNQGLSELDGIGIAAL